VCFRERGFRSDQSPLAYRSQFDFDLVRAHCGHELDLFTGPTAAVTATAVAAGQVQLCTTRDSGKHGAVPA
jgi:hypothetical protein